MSTSAGGPGPGQVPGPQESLDPTQVALMDEMCLLVDEKDQVVGRDTKRNCHLVSNALPLHRAFSVFAFSADGQRLLLQRRAPAKITFPGLWTNTCCSHPLWPSPRAADADLAGTEADGASGVKMAASRKLEHELGIRLPADQLHFLTRIHYKAPSSDAWGEHEIDYILIARGDLAPAPNPNEVSRAAYVTRAQLRRLVRASDGALDDVMTPDQQRISKDQQLTSNDHQRTSKDQEQTSQVAGSPLIDRSVVPQGMTDECRESEEVVAGGLTPWFRLVCQSGMLESWWDHLDDLGRVEKLDAIIRF